MSYDRALTVFSPDGHLFQVEYAMEAVNKGTTCVGIRGKEVLVLAVEKKVITKLQDPKTIRKICKLDDHIICTFAGLNADARVLIDKARVECQSHRLSMDDPASIEYMARYIADQQQKYTQKGGVRPFGLCLLVIGFDKFKSPRLFLTEPSGIHSEWQANSIGRNSKGVKEFLERTYKPDMSTDDTVKLAIQSIIEVAQIGAANIEVSVMGADNQLTLLSVEEIQQYIDTIQREAEALASSERRPTGMA